MRLTKHARAQLLIMIGACGYVYVDSEFSMDSYIWGAAYIFFFVVEMVRPLAQILPQRASQKTGHFRTGSPLPAQTRALNSGRPPLSLLSRRAGLRLLPFTV